MPTSSSSLLLAMSVLALPGGAVVSSASPASVAVQSHAPAPQTAPKATKPRPPAASAGTAKSTRKAKPAATSGKKGKPAADCEIPEAKVAATSPIPVAADPLAATMAPCADTKPKP